MIHPTPYGELNGVLAHLLEGARARLGDNFIGAYLQGSFAVGDFTPWSDCDFIIVTERDLTPGEIGPLLELHAQIHELPAPYWRNGLEGSYAPAAVLRRWSTAPRDPPAELVDPVPPEALRAEVRASLDRVLAQGLEPMEMVAWQAFWVGLFCRMLYTLSAGQVASKKVSMTWAQGALDPAWRDLIARAQALRKGHPESEAPADPALVAATRAFALYARELAAAMELRAS